VERSFDSKLDELRNLILRMGGQVEKALQTAVSAIVERNPKLFNEVHTIEAMINEDQIKVDSCCVNLLAKQGPVAKDLRLIMSIIKINADLERMGDQAVNIAHTGKDYLQRQPLGRLSDIVKMNEIVRKMVKESLDTFVSGDSEAARRILLMDDEVDSLKNSVFRDLIVHIKQNPNDVEACMDLILMARNLERVGDHATNIAEDVIYVVTGRDMRHGGKYQ
jgi:phosphate transport system protein